MATHAERVAAFMRMVGQDLPSEPRIPSEEIRWLRARLIMEEALEAVEALGFAVTYGAFIIKKVGFVPDGTPDLAQIAGECADLSVVTIGTMRDTSGTDFGNRG